MICVFTKIYAVIGAHGCSLKRTTIVRRERRERGRKRYIFVCVDANTSFYRYFNLENRTNGKNAETIYPFGGKNVHSQLFQIKK